MNAEIKSEGLPFLSVITVVLNGERHLDQAIQSVISQTYGNIEYIIIDGGSTDGSLKIINQYRDQIDRIVSEPDQGIADAMNKGINLASGDYLIFLHADDYFYCQTSIADTLGSLDSRHEIILCDIIFGAQQRKMSPRGLTFWMNFKTGIFHQGAICNRKLFNDVGDFDNQFRITMDYDFFLRAYRKGVTAKKCPIVLSVMRDTGISSSRNWNDLLRRFNEEKKVHEKNCTSAAMKYLYSLYWLLYLPYRRLKSCMQG